jgi:hypothetical protein
VKEQEEHRNRPHYPLWIVSSFYIFLAKNCCALSVQITSLVQTEVA